MTHPTITGALRLTSTNGDAPAVLASASAILEQLVALGAAYSVEVTLRPADAAITVRIEDEPRPTVPSGRIISSAPIEVPSAPPIELPAPNPQTARSILPRPSGLTLENLTVAPDQWSAVLAELNAGKRLFRSLSRQSRLECLLRHGHELTAQLGHVPSQGEWDRNKPHWMPTGAAVGGMRHPGWPQTGWPEWQTLFAISTATPSGASE